MASSSQELSLQPAVWPGLHRLPKWDISQMVLLNLIVSGITSDSNVYVFIYVHWKNWNPLKSKLKPFVLSLHSIASGFYTKEREGGTNHATCWHGAVLNQNNRLVVYQCHFTVLRQLKHRRFFSPTVMACIIKRWWNHLSGFDGSC